MEELTAVHKARKFIREAAVKAVPVDLSRYAALVNARIEVRGDLDDDEAGHAFTLGGQNFIFVNGNHREERQRFTVLHEIGHMVLELPSQHAGSLTALGLGSYRRRPREEVLCDVFAAECLLPHHFFKKDIDDLEVGFESVRELAGRYKASIASTGSRLAAHSAEPCAFVLIEDGVIRYVSRSKTLREMGAWIDVGVPAPAKSVAARLMNDPASDAVYDELPADIWFSKPPKNYALICEEAIPPSEWNQSLSLLWLDGALRRATNSYTREDDDTESLLKELDGTLPWPGKNKRR